MHGINPYRVRIPFNNVLVRLPKPVNNEIEFAGGQNLILDTTFEPASHAMVSGEIVAVCEKFKGEAWVPKVEVGPGDEVIIDYFEMLNNMGTLVHRFIEHPQEMYLEWEGEYFVFIKYHELFCKADLTPLNGYVIYEGVYDEEKFGEYSKQTLSEKEGIAVRVGAPNVSYPTQHSDDVDINPGDHFFFKKGMYRKLEYDLHATHDKNLYLVQRRYINVKK